MQINILYQSDSYRIQYRQIQSIQMIKSVKQHYQDDDQNYQFSRDSYIVTIRKDTRQDLFRKRRKKILQKQPQTLQKSLDNSLKQTSKTIIIDSDMKQIIEILLQQPYTSDMIAQLRDDIISPDILKIHRGVIGIRKIICQYEEPPLQQIIKQDIHTFLIQLALSNYPQIKLEAAWSLASLAYTSSQNCNYIIEKGAIDVFIRLLESQNIHILQQAFFGIGNIGSDSTRARDIFIQKGVISILTSHITTRKELKIIQEGCWVLSILCRGDTRPEYKLIEKGIVVLCCMIQAQIITDQQIIAQCLFAIGCHCQAADGKQKVVASTNLLSVIIRYMICEDDRLAIATMRVIGNLSTGGEDISKLLLDLNILDYFLVCFNHKKMLIRRQAAWILSNLTASGMRTFYNIINKVQLLDKLLEMLIWDELAVRKQIVYVFGNMTSCSDSSLNIEQFYVHHGIIEAIFNLMKQGDEPVILTALRNLFNILFYANQRQGETNIVLKELYKNDFLEILQSLQDTTNRKIYYEVNKIITYFFETELIKDNI